ncbi:MAG: HPr(Ser) kinase/phosphatase [Lentisphaerae bacterium]|nr:HPr(Ser) kinase/phosphatase [Lentisphaerota bacterium]
MKPMVVTVKEFYEAAKQQFDIKTATGNLGMQRLIMEPPIHRPGLALAGFFKHFAFRRVQVLGMAENEFLHSMPKEKRSQALKSLFERRIPCIIIARSRRVWPEMFDLSKKYNVPVLRTPLITGNFINSATLIMEHLMAPKTTVLGTMVDIMGIGVLIEGKPGIGKSEAALALVNKGHSLVADDVTVLRKVMNTIVASSVPATRYHMEIRGVGIIHIPSLYGVTSVRDEMPLDMIVSLRDAESLIQGRLDLEKHTRDLIGFKIPVLTIPVAPGRDLANIIEAAILNKKLERLGRDAVKELDDKLIAMMAENGDDK